MGKQASDRKPANPVARRVRKKPVSENVKSEMLDSPPSGIREIDDVNLKFYIAEQDRLRIYSTALVSEQGHFLFYNKLAKEHFEGSLNNLATKSIFDLMIPVSRRNAARAFGDDAHGGRFSCVIYSKNTKRKYLKLSRGAKIGNEDIYYRYLKGLCCRVRPLVVRFSEEKAELDGNWVLERMKRNPLHSLRCYLLETRLSARLPPLPDNIHEDPVIIRFVQQSERKLLDLEEQKASESSEPEVESDEEEEQDAVVVKEEPLLKEEPPQDNKRTRSKLLSSGSLMELAGSYVDD